MEVNFYNEEEFLEMATMLCKTAMENRKDMKDVPVHMVFRAIKAFVESPAIMGIFWEKPFPKEHLKRAFNESYVRFKDCIDDVKPWKDMDIAIFADYSIFDAANPALSMLETRIDGEYIFLRPIESVFLARLMSLFVDYNYRGRVYLLNLGVETSDSRYVPIDAPKRFCIIGFDGIVDLGKFVDMAFKESASATGEELDPTISFEKMAHEILAIDRNEYDAIKDFFNGIEGDDKK